VVHYLVFWWRGNVNNLEELGILKIWDIPNNQKGSSDLRGFANDPPPEEA
jgi:hypothetical protein